MAVFKLTIIDGTDTPKQLNVEQHADLSLTPYHAIEANDQPVGTGNPLPVADSTAGAALAAMNQLLTAIATNTGNAAGVTPTASAGLESGHVFKTSAGQLLSLSVAAATANGVVLVLDAAAMPNPGSVVFPKYVLPITEGQYASIDWTIPATFVNGVCVVLSSVSNPFLYESPGGAFFSAQCQ